MLSSVTSASGLQYWSTSTAPKEEKKEPQELYKEKAESLNALLFQYIVHNKLIRPKLVFF